ncbi:MAG TPA: helix-turn-helix transcriptional regulator [Micromonosporaceae bacterium]|nr:helix-turn-helix transcriptional regulator [Micromonosporaceae bacterium]
MARQLVTEVRSALRRHRQIAELTQHDLAQAAGMAQSTLAHIERGTRVPSLPVVQRLFAALGLQLPLTVEPLDADVDAAITRLAKTPLDERLDEAGIPAICASLAEAGLRYVVEGPAAAALQGAPVPVDAMDMAMLWADADRFTAWLGQWWARRWDRNWGEFGFQAVDPRIDGPHDWQLVNLGEVRLRARMCDALPASLSVRHAEREYRVVPLAEVEAGDPRAGDLLRRYRERSRVAQSPP